MPTLHVTAELIARVEAWNAAFHAARMGALAELPGNPFGVEIRRLPAGVASKVRHPLLRGKNRILHFQEEDLPLLDDLLRGYRDDGLPFTLNVPFGQMTPGLFRALMHAGLWSGGSGATPALIPEAATGEHLLANDSAIHIRRSGPDEKEQYLDLFQRAFGDREERLPEYRAFQWAEDALPGSARYIAEIDGTAVGMASFPIIDGVGYLGTAGVLPEFCRRGVQTALIRRRVADANSLGCDLILAGGVGTTTFRNFERAEFRLVPSGFGWRDLPTAKA